MPGDQILQAAGFVTQRGALWRLAEDYKAQRHGDAPGSATDCGQRQLRDLREETEGVGGETRGATFPDSQAAHRAPAELFWARWVYRGYNQLGCEGFLHPLMWWGWKVLKSSPKGLSSMCLAPLKPFQGDQVRAFCASWW